MSTYEVPHPLKSCVLGVSEVFAYCHKKKTLQQFKLPQVYCCLMCLILMILFSVFPIVYRNSGLLYVFLICVLTQMKSLSDFNVQDTDGVSSQQVVQLKPEQEVRGYHLGPVSLVLSPHRLWLASVSPDGLLRIRETASMVGAHFILFFLSPANVWIRFSLSVVYITMHQQERYIELHCHSCRDGGAQSVSFSADSQTLLTAGFKGGSLVCTNLR